MPRRCGRGAFLSAAESCSGGASSFSIPPLMGACAVPGAGLLEGARLCTLGARVSASSCVPRSGTARSARRCFLGLWRSAAQWACDSPSVPAAAGVPASAFCAWGVGTRALRSALFPRYQPPPGCQVVRRRSAREGPSDRRGRRGAGGSGGLRPVWHQRGAVTLLTFTSPWWRVEPLIRKTQSLLFRRL